MKGNTIDEEKEQIRKRITREHVLEMIAKRKAERKGDIYYESYSKPEANCITNKKPVIEKGHIKQNMKCIGNKTNPLESLRSKDIKKLEEYKQLTDVFSNPIIDKNKFRYKSLLDKASNASTKLERKEVPIYETQNWSNMVDGLSNQFSHIKLLQLRSKFSCPPKEKQSPSTISSVHDKCLLPNKGIISEKNVYSSSRKK